SSPEFDTAMHIDVMGLMKRAWDADLVVELPVAGTLPS
ncbi:MAG: hypothetical protein QOD34_815, partial [Mycobacterium sp.]|nr:hypothetical protein [Mycobacterium sp.]